MNERASGRRNDADGRTGLFFSHNFGFAARMIDARTGGSLVARIRSNTCNLRCTTNYESTKYTLGTRTRQQEKLRRDTWCVKTAAHHWLRVVLSRILILSNRNGDLLWVMARVTVIVVVIAICEV
jgi:hypothetical protein